MNMARLQAANNARTTLTEYMSYDATLANVASSAVLPAAVPYRITVDSEIMTVTAVAGNTLTVTRGQEGTAAVEHFAGVNVENRWTAGMYAGLITAEELAAAIAQIPVASNKNLLHNWDFRNPVNQRGLSSYPTNWSYTVDRWMQGAEAAISVESGGVRYTKGTETSNCDIRQMLENFPRHIGKKVTLSAEIDGVIYSGTGIMPSSGYPSFYSNGVFTLGIGTDGSLGYMFIGFTGATTGQSFLISRAKLEYGSFSTLANDPPADYGDQLMLCKRYAKSFGDGPGYRMCWYGADVLTFTIPNEIQFRIIPSIESGNMGVRTVSGEDVPGFVLSFENKGANIFVVARKTNHGLTDAQLAFKTKVILSADL